MDQSKVNPRLLGRLLLVVYLIVILWCIYTLFSAIAAKQDTSLVHISTDDRNAVISISQPDHTAEAIGVGQANIRLRPGLYEVVASHDRLHAYYKLRVIRGVPVDAKLQLTNDPILTSPDDISFVGTDSLLAYGVSSNQVYATKQAFYKYNHLLKKVTVDASTINRAPHDRNSSDPRNTIYFSGTIDNSPYQARLVYNLLLDTVRLYITNVDGAQVFDSGIGTDQNGD